MRRVTSMVFIGGWASFFGTVSAAASLAIVSAGFPNAAKFPLIGGEAARIAGILIAEGNMAILAASATAFVFAAVVLLLLLSMWMLQARDQADRTAGEKLAVATLVVAGLFVCGLGAAGMDLLTEEVSVYGIALVLALSVVALLFDRMIEVDDAAEAEDEAFYRNALMVGRGLGRDVMLPPGHGETLGQPERRR